MSPVGEPEGEVAAQEAALRRAGMVTEYLTGALARQEHHAAEGGDPHAYDEQVDQAQAVVRNAAVQRGMSIAEAERHTALVTAGIVRRRSHR